MRYLNKIIFINSAQIKYTEISLDGNVHFIGTQGVGKSTLLRAILFFYNADTQGLGIPKQKSSYVDYYFSNSNSYIIYEVIREDGEFCVVSYKSQHKVCFRFFDGKYNQSYFINENGNVPDNWDGIAQRLDASKIFYTKRKIEEYREYRDIIYGNHESKKYELRKYSISESKDYQQVPKTIQNVFLNSKMEAEFIKQIIILSLDNNIQIDLTKYTHHLNDFEMQLMDIRRFKTPSTASLAENISKLHIAIKCLEQEKIQFAKELTYAVNENERKKPELAEKLKTQQNQEIILNEELIQSKECFNEIMIKINGDIRIQDENLKEAKTLIEYYDKENIQEIIVKVGKENDFKMELSNLQNEKNLLSAQFTDIEMKFKALFDALENQYKDFLNEKNAHKNEIYAEFLTFKGNIAEKFGKQIFSLREEHKEQVEFLRADLENKIQITNDLRIKKEEIKYMHFFEMEIVSLEKEIQELNNSIRQLPIEKESLSKQIEIIRKEWDFDGRNFQKDFEQNKNNIENKIANTKKQIAEIEAYINNSKDSLYGWLTENYPSWEKTIGKVIDNKNVLFNSSLSPRFAGENGNFYGIEINLNEIGKTVKTISDYEAEKSELNEQIQLFKQSIFELGIKLDEDKKKLKNKYSPKIKEKEEIFYEIEYNFEHSILKLSDKTIELNELKNKADIERKKRLEILEKEIEEIAEKTKEAKLKIEDLEEEQNKTIITKEKERDEIIENEKNRINALLNDIEIAIKFKNTEFEQQKENVYERKNRELFDKGIDTERLNEIENKLQILSQDLKFIENNRDFVAVYKEKKKSFIDKIHEFEQEKQKAEKRLTFERLKHEEEMIELNKKLTVIQSIIADLNEQIAIISRDTDEFAGFKSQDLFKSIEIYFFNHEIQKTEKRVSILIDDIKSIHNKRNEKANELYINIINFLGKFSENNILKFPKQLTDENTYLVFAKELSDFIEEKKIEQIEKEMNERFADVVSTIGTETENLLAESSKIQVIITKINNDFVEKNFVGVIKRIELKVENSKNEIFQLLLEIKKYNNENGMKLGSVNLFNLFSDEKKNREAVDLLKQFVKKINESKRDYISLSDSFELKFRIEENQNDTGWVEKLSNVGSEGTDTLVKAMVNIMLLNVFKENVSKKFKDFKLHCMMDEIGKLHPNNVRGILKFANERNIWLINGSPIENDALAFTHIYKLHKDEKNNITKVKRIITQYTEI